MDETVHWPRHSEGRPFPAGWRNAGGIRERHSVTVCISRINPIDPEGVGAIPEWRIRPVKLEDAEEINEIRRRPEGKKRKAVFRRGEYADILIMARVK